MEKSWLDSLIEQSTNTKGVDTKKLSMFIEDVEQILYLQESLKKAGIVFDVKLINKKKRVIKSESSEEVKKTTQKTVTKEKPVKRKTIKTTPKKAKA